MVLVVLEPSARPLLVTLLVLGTPSPIDHGHASEPSRRRLPMWLNACG
jgi:hypothetical protein